MKEITVPKDTQIAVVGDIHEHSEQFFKLLDAVKPNAKLWFVSVGDVIDKGYGESAFNSVTAELMNLQKHGIGFAVRGNHEIKAIKMAKKNGELSKELQWWRNQPLCLRFKFPNTHALTIVHAGVTPKNNISDLYTDYEVCYVRDVDENGKMISLVWKEENGKKMLVKPRPGTNWHEEYNGRFGYIASGHNAQRDGEAKYYAYSCNLDSCVYTTGRLTCQIFNERGGLGEKIVVEGEAFKPDIEGI